MADEGDSDLDVARLKFDGGRYSALGFPLEGIAELTKYQHLIQHAARHLWREAHPGRNLPDFFEQSVRMRLREVKKGSVVPVLAPDREAMSEAGGILASSIDFVDDLFESIVQDLYVPFDLSDDFQRAIRSFGSSFVGDERSVFRSGTGHEVKYGHDQRKALLEAMKGDIKPVSGVLVGRLEVLDVALKFALTDADGRRIPGSFSEPTIFDDLHDVHRLRDSADLIWVECDFLTDRDNHPSRIEDVRAVGQFASSTDEWSLRLAQVASVPKGWLDGDGERVGGDALLLGLGLLQQLQALRFPRPSMFPEEDGGLRFEWLTEVSHTTAEVTAQQRFSIYHLNVASGEEVFEPETQSISAVIDELAGLIERPAAGVNAGE